eukprot:TRINITY_DN74079_c0_g1_i1.p1 TRINITY_DN74079_c0_g1~~TRINITY_DN74079_c0_g1_i1.p1  ORF type:complete len:325 (-),score=25.13 TRINITY_DN74079_c0_g1_i1:92-1009(-)
MGAFDDFPPQDLKSMVMKSSLAQLSPSEPDIGAVSTNDASSERSASMSSSGCFEDGEEIAVNEGTTRLMSRTLDEVPIIEDDVASGFSLSYILSSALVCADSLDQGDAPFHLIASHEEKHTEETSATQDCFAKELPRVPQNALNVDDLITANSIVQEAVSTDSQGRIPILCPEEVSPASYPAYESVFPKGIFHTSDRIAVESWRNVVDRRLKHSAFFAEDSEDSGDSVDSGINGPPISRTTAYDSGYAPDVRLPKAYVTADVPSMTSFLLREGRKRWCAQVARAHFKFTDGSRGGRGQIAKKISL